MPKRIYLIVCLLFISQIMIHAQKQQNNWLFGRASGLTWDTTRDFIGQGVFGTTGTAILSNIPSNIPNSPINTGEGCFSVSDNSGNLLFFSDGMTVWNKNLVVMPNGTGLNGHPSSAESGIAIAYPKNHSKYLAISLGAEGTNNLSYSVIDLTLDGGLGVIVEKNILLTGQFGILSESVTAVKHSNKRDFWIVAPGRTSNTPKTYINVWKVNENGVQKELHSSVEIDIITRSNLPGGYIKMTPDGKHFAWTCFYEPYIVFGDFDSTLGIISNVRVIPSRYSLGYGVEFSLSGKYLYITYVPATQSSNGGTSMLIFDFDDLLTASDPSLVNPIRILKNAVSPSNGEYDQFGAVQMGPDKRLYVSRFNSKGLFVLTDPENPVTSPVYRLMNLMSGIAVWGLPSFTGFWFDMQIIPPSVNCVGIESDYTLAIYDGLGFETVDKVTVDFGDGSPNSIKVISPVEAGNIKLPHIYKQTGKHPIELTAYKSNGDIQLVNTDTVQVNSCVLKVNRHVRGEIK